MTRIIVYWSTFTKEPKEYLVWTENHGEATRLVITLLNHLIGITSTL